MALKPTTDELGVETPQPGPPKPIFKIVPGSQPDPKDRFRDYPSRDLSGSKISQIQEDADGGDPREWIQLCEEAIEKDSKIGQLAAVRSAAVLGINHQVLPSKLVEEKERPKAELIAKFCDHALKTVNTDEMIYDQLDCIMKPFGVDWIDWGFDENGKVVPLYFRRIPPSHLVWAQNSDQLVIVEPGKPWELKKTGFIIPPYCTVRSIANMRRDHPTRAGLMRTLIWLYFFKNIATKDWIAASERYGMPVRVLKLNRADFENEEFYAKARAAVRDIGANASGVIDKDSELEIIATNLTSGNSIFKQLIDHIDKSMAQLVLGHELTSQSSPGAGQLGITAAIMVRQDLVEADCRTVSQSIKRDILTPMTGWNFGWDVAERFTPEYDFAAEPVLDLLNEARVIDIMANRFPALKFSRQAFMERFGWDPPLKSDDELTGSPNSGGSGAKPNVSPAEV